MNAREIIFEVLLELEQNPEQYTNELLFAVLDKYAYLDPRDRGLIKRIVQGVVEQRIRLDYCLDLFSKVPSRKMKKPVRAILRMGAYQILFLDQIPDSAACNEAVSLAKKKHLGNLSGFINGVLRTLSREKEKIAYPDPEKDPIRSFSVRYSWPEDLVRFVNRSYDMDTMQRMGETFLKEPPLSVRLTAGRTCDPGTGTAAEPEVVNMAGTETVNMAEPGTSNSIFAESDLEMRWEASGIQVSPHPFLPYARCLAGVNGVASLAGFEEGAFQVQDISSMLVGEAAGALLDSMAEAALPGDGAAGMLKVLDVCAAPGGKSIHTAERLGENGTLTAFDISERKLERIRENAQRMRITNLCVQQKDASMRDPSLVGSADLVLADVPCSGLGVLGRKPDIKYHWTREGQAELQVIQKKIVKNVSEYVRPGGYFLYSTCTIANSENSEMVEWIGQNTDLAVRDLRMCYRKETLSAIGDKGFSEAENGVAYLQLIPGVHPCDGFFIALFQKTDKKE